MNYIISADTDIGIKKSTNQDSLSVKRIHTQQGQMALAVLCDGMGGLEKGEVASASVIRAFDAWTRERLPVLCEGILQEAVIREEWNQLVQQQNMLLHQYGARQGVTLGTTLVALLLTEQQYFVMNVGDSRVYEITDGLYQITKDQTFVAREVELGNLTPEQAAVDPRRSVLLQCIGASDYVYPDLFCGVPKQNAVYMLCSDGFRHEISPQELYQELNPAVLADEYSIQQNVRRLIELNKARHETDNISVVTVRTF